jgi:hypothetical protein
MVGAYTDLVGAILPRLEEPGASAGTVAEIWAEIMATIETLLMSPGDDNGGGGGGANASAGASASAGAGIAADDDDDAGDVDAHLAHVLAAEILPRSRTAGEDLQRQLVSILDDGAMFLATMVHGSSIRARGRFARGCVAALARLCSADAGSVTLATRELALSCLTTRCAQVLARFEPAMGAECTAEVIEVLHVLRDLRLDETVAAGAERPGTTRAADVSRAHLLTLYAHFVPLVHCSLAEVRAAVAEVLVEVGTALGARRLDV